MGQSVDETIKQFQRIKDDPVKAINELDKSLHFLTATQLAQISTLEEQEESTKPLKLPWKPMRLQRIIEPSR